MKSLHDLFEVPLYECVCVCVCIRRKAVILRDVDADMSEISTQACIDWRFS